MDKSTFTSSACGKFWEVSLGGDRDWAFIPNNLPESLEFSQNIWVLLVKARAELARLDRLFESPVISIPQWQEFYEISYPTARSDIQRLIKAGILVEYLGSERPQIYFASEVIKIADEDD